MCGLKSVTPQTLIVNGDTVQQGEYPWQVGIYGARKQFVCGGALISQRLILTGELHYFWNLLTQLSICSCALRNKLESSVATNNRL